MIEAWIEFETEAGRGYGHLRLKDGKAWTLLTALHELKGFEEPKGADAPARASSTAPTATARPGWRSAAARPTSSATRRQPYVRDHRRRPGRHRARRAAAPARRADDHRRDATRAPATRWRKRYKSLCLHDPVWYDHLPYLPFPDQLAGVLAEGQDRRLAGDVRRVMELNYWGSTTAQERALRRGRRRSGRSSSSATARRSRCARSSWCSPPACRASRTCRVPRAWTSSEGEQHHSSQHPGPDAYAGQEGRRDRLEQLRARHLRRAVGARRRRHDGAALVDPRRAARTR